MTDSSHFQECSFCGKPKNAVKKLIVGDNVAICNDCISLCGDLLKDGPDSEVESTEANSLYPDDIKRFLDQYVIGQDRAKMILGVAVSNHYKRINHKSDTLSVQKANVLVLGPTGSGKTLLAKTVAKYLDVPFVVADATTLTEAGYVGADVDSMISLLVQRADGDIEKAQRGIVFIDEIDKIGRKSESASITRDVSGEGVQQALLKIIEGTECQVMPNSTGRKHPGKETIQINTANILFICGGAFDGLEKIIQLRSQKTGIGFVAEIASQETGSLNKYLHQIESYDLVKFGLIPEFVGRLPVIAVLNELDVSDLIKILLEPKNALIKQYMKLFQFQNVDLEFTKDALYLIAENAVKKKTGARGLRSIIEHCLLDIMFQLPNLSNVSKVIIDESVISKNQHAKIIYK